MIKVEKPKYTTQAEQLMVLLDQLQLSFRERRIAENYLKGEAGKETLRSLSFRDMAGVSSETKNIAYKLLESYCIKKQFEEAGRYFNFLYALGVAPVGTVFILITALSLPSGTEACRLTEARY